MSRESNIALWSFLLSMVGGAVAATIWIVSELNSRDVKHALDAGVKLEANQIRQEIQSEFLKDENWRVSHYRTRSINPDPEEEKRLKEREGYLDREIERRKRISDLLQQEQLILEQQVRKDLRDK